MYLLLISSICHAIADISIDCGELYDDDSLSPWGYVYYLCNGTVIADRNNTDVSEIFGLHKYGKNNSYVDGLLLTNQNLTSFPTNLETIFPNLRHIVLSSNNITRLTNTDLKPHKLLSDLLMDNNQITYLEADLFDGMDKLITVNLTSNRISYIDHGIIIPLRMQIRLRNNTCIDEQRIGLPDTSCFMSSILKQCAQLPIATSNASMANVKSFSKIFVDRTQMKEQELITERPDFNIKPPKQGEIFHCQFKKIFLETAPQDQKHRFKEFSGGEEEIEDEKCEELLRWHKEVEQKEAERRKTKVADPKPVLERICENGEWKWQWFMIQIMKSPSSGI